MGRHRWRILVKKRRFIDLVIDVLVAMKGFYNSTQERKNDVQTFAAGVCSLIDFNWF